MTTKARATIEDLYRIPENVKAEIVNGEAVLMSPIGDAPNYAAGEIAQKRSDYFAAGTLVVWDVDLLGEEVVKVYRAADPDKPTIYRRCDAAEAEPAVPGWRMPVDDLFA